MIPVSSNHYQLSFSTFHNSSRHHVSPLFSMFSPRFIILHHSSAFSSYDLPSRCFPLGFQALRYALQAFPAAQPPSLLPQSVGNPVAPAASNDAKFLHEAFAKCNKWCYELVILRVCSCPMAVKPWLFR